MMWSPSSHDRCQLPSNFLLLPNHFRSDNDMFLSESWVRYGCSTVAKVGELGKRIDKFSFNMVKYCTYVLSKLINKFDSILFKAAKVNK